MQLFADILIIIINKNAFITHLTQHIPNYAQVFMNKVELKVNKMSKTLIAPNMCSL